jgi:hypothetical protein
MWDYFSSMWSVATDWLFHLSWIVVAVHAFILPKIPDILIVNKHININKIKLDNFVEKYLKYSVVMFFLFFIIPLLYKFYHFEYSREIFIFLCCLPFLRFFIAPIFFTKFKTGPQEAELSYGILIVGIAVLIIPPIKSHLTSIMFESRVMHYNLEANGVKHIVNFDVIYLGEGKEFGHELNAARAVFKPTKESDEFVKDDFKNLFIFEIEHFDAKYQAACFTKTMEDLEDRRCFIN